MEVYVCVDNPGRKWLNCCNLLNGGTEQKFLPLSVCFIGCRIRINTSGVDLCATFEIFDYPGTNMSVTIRRMQEEDILQVVEIEKTAFTRPWTKSIFKATLLLPYAAYYVAADEEADGRIVGACGVRKILGEGDISNVAVHPAYRRRGICRAMLETLLFEAREDGVKDFTLEVRAGNAPAIRLYESFGFKTEGIRPGFYDHPREDGLIMWLRARHSGDCDAERPNLR